MRKSYPIVYLVKNNVAGTVTVVQHCFSGKFNLIRRLILDRLLACIGSKFEKTPILCLQ